MRTIHGCQRSEEIEGASAKPLTAEQAGANNKTDEELVRVLVVFTYKLNSNRQCALFSSFLDIYATIRQIYARGE